MGNPMPDPGERNERETTSELIMIAVLAAVMGAIGIATVYGIWRVAHMLMEGR